MRKSITKFLPKNLFARRVFILAGGTAAGQIITVLSAPLLTRLYSPEDFGLLAVYASLLMSCGVISSLRYHLAIPLPEGDQEATHVVVLCLLVVLGMTLLTGVLIFFFRDKIAQSLNIPLLTSYLWLLPLGLFLLGTYHVFNYWAIRVKAFRVIARTKFTQSASMVAIQIGGYLLGPIALLLGKVSQQAAGVTTLGVLAIRKQWPLFISTRWTDIRQAARRYRRFPIYSTWGGGFNRVSTELPPVLFAAFFSPAAAGFYALANRVISIPLALIGKSIADVFFSDSPEALRNGNLGILVNNVQIKLAQIVLPLALFLFVAGPDLFKIVFGENWVLAGQVARWLVPMLYTQFIVSPLSLVMTVVEQQGYDMLLQSLLLVSRLVAILVGVWIDDFIIAVILYSLASSFIYFLYYIVITIFCNIPWYAVWYSSFKSLPISFFVISPLLLADVLNYDQNGFFALGGVSCILIICYYVYLFYNYNYNSKMT